MRAQRKHGSALLLRLVGTLTLVCLLASGCSDARAEDTSPVFALEREATSGIAAVDASRTNVLPAPLVRSLLQDLLAEHSDLSIEVMRQAVDGDVQPGSLVELTRNTDELTITIGVVYGPEGAAAFDQLWTNHIQFFNDYAAARGANNKAAVDEAILMLGHYETDFSSYIDTATSGEADFHAVLHVLHSHVDQLLQQADAWAADDFAAAIALGSQAHRHMDVIANALAVGISRQQPAAFTGDPVAPDAVACAALQLDASALVAAAGTLAETRRMGFLEAEAAAVAEFDLVRAGADAAAVQAYDDAAALEDGDVNSAAGRAKLHDAVLAMLATSNCTGLIIGG